MKSFRLGPRPYNVIQEDDPDGTIGKPLGVWSGRGAVAVVTEKKTTHLLAVAAVELWLQAYNSKGTLTITRGPVGTTPEVHTLMRLTGVEYERKDAVTYQVTLTYKQEVD
jgi:hypothetical protein